MVEVSYRESHFTPDATNYDCYPNHINPNTGFPYICLGLLQIMGTDSRLYNPSYNIDQAYQKWLISGYTPWGY